jgi:hypothetical protein
MDKIAEKPYLPVTKKRSVPRRLRILAIDVPEMRSEGIDGECRVNLSRVYVDGVAPPKKIGEEKEVMQKSLARALVKCRHAQTHRIGIEMVEASVSDLNPHNLRRMHQFGSYKYDPGKWATRTSSTSDTGTASSNEDTSNAKENEKVENLDDADSDTAAREIAEAKPPSTSSVKVDSQDGGTVLASAEDEFDAPWNQYAWIQELQLRVSATEKALCFLTTRTHQEYRLVARFSLVRQWSRRGGSTDSCGEVSTKPPFHLAEKHGNGSCCQSFIVIPLVRTRRRFAQVGRPTSHMPSLHMALPCNECPGPFDSYKKCVKKKRFLCTLFMILVYGEAIHIRICKRP